MYEQHLRHYSVCLVLTLLKLIGSGSLLLPKVFQTGSSFTLDEEKINSFIHHYVLFQRLPLHRRNDEFQFKAKLLRWEPWIVCHSLYSQGLFFWWVIILNTTSELLFGRVVILNGHYSKSRIRDSLQSMAIPSKTVVLFPKQKCECSMPTRASLFLPLAIIFDIILTFLLLQFQSCCTICMHILNAKSN